MNKGKKWCVWFAVFATILVVGLGGMTVVVDPYFHYHKPLESLEYPLDNQRYQNDGIVKHFDYNAIITGTSMTENFLASELDELFGVDSIKVPLSGASLKEVNDMLQRAVDANPEIKMVVRSLDIYKLFEDKDYMREDYEYPFYLYDSNWFNDVEYLLNKEVFLADTLGVLQYTKEGNLTTNFDQYSRWDNIATFSSEKVLKKYDRPENTDEKLLWTDEVQKTVEETVIQNIVTLAQENPEIQFYYFYPPYSIVWWDSQMRTGQLERHVKALELASELILEVDNIHLFSFVTDYETILNLNNYKDTTHYSSEFNSRILESMENGSFVCTKEKNASYWEDVMEWFTSFDYDGYLEEQGYEDGLDDEA